MLIAARRGNRRQAPENTRIALLSAWTTGAQALWIDVRLAGDNQLVAAADPTTDRITGHPGEIASMRLSALRADDFDLSVGFPDGGGYRYRPNGRPVRFEPFTELLDELPQAAPLIINAADAANRTEELAVRVAGALRARNRLAHTVFVAADAALRAALRAKNAATYADGEGQDPDSQVALLDGADGLVTRHTDVFDDDGEPTKLGRAIADRGLGAILRPAGVAPSTAELTTAAHHAFVHAILTDSTLDLEPMRVSRVHVESDFAGETVNRRSFSFGYAKPHADTRVWQDDGVHITVDDYDGPDAFQLPEEPTLDDRVKLLEQQMWTALSDWPFYSGGGFGVTRGIDGDFVAEVAYTVERVAQATTLEMAVVNVDPGAHVDGPPAGPREQDTFYDPHGAPPFVGTEHDESDGFRINWNLGTQYLTNQYGTPCGNGTALSAELRLERRGTYFSAYYRNSETPGWICTGVMRNDSLNPRVFLRCVAKRWRQGGPNVIPNRWRFGPLSIRIVGPVTVPGQEVVE